MRDSYKLELESGAVIVFVQGDITREQTDAIVNAANSTLMGGGGVDGAIHRAGGPVILEECKKIVARQGHLPPGEAVSTTAGRLPAAFVIHTVGPIWHGGMHGEAALLASCHRNSLRLADRLELHTMAFPAISTGAYGYPLNDAAFTAINATLDALREARSIHEVRFVLFDNSVLEVFVEAAQAAIQRHKANWRLHHIPGKTE